MPRTITQILWLLLASAFVLAMPLLVYLCSPGKADAQEPPYIYFTAAEPNDLVAGYEARVRALVLDVNTGLSTVTDVRYLSDDTAPRVVLDTLPLEPIIDVRARDADGKPGPWSRVHDEVPDLNNDGVIDALDLIQLAQHFGDIGYEPDRFVKMVYHWGHQTEWNEALELRRCVGE